MKNMSSDNELDFKIYIHRTGLTTGILFVVIVLFNYFVDPYGVWQTSRINGINNYMTLTGYERLYKMIEVSRAKKIETLFLGSSTVYNALYPETWFKCTGRTAYNAGINSAHLLEIREILLQTIKFHPELKEVVLGLNWFMFSARWQGMDKTFPEGQVGWKYPLGKKAVITLFSKDALSDSISSIQESQKNKDNTIDCDGKLNPEFLKKSYSSAGDLDKFSIDTKGMISLFRMHVASYPPMMDIYRSIIEICESNNINIKVYINPVHNTYLESIDACGANAYFEEWKRQLVKITPVWDFAYHSEVVNEPFSLSRRYWRHAQHPMALTGDFVLKKIAGKDLPKDVGEFGILLCENNVEESLAKEREAHEKWRQENQETVQSVKTIVERKIVENR